VFERLDWAKYEVSINGDKLNNLKFADDVVWIHVQKQELSKMAEALFKECIEIGLLESIDETKYMGNIEDPHPGKSKTIFRAKYYSIPERYEQVNSN